MANQNPLLDDIAGLMTGAMGAARSAGEEAKTLMQSQAARMIADMDLAGRDELEAYKTLLQGAIERIETLEAEVAALKKSASTAG